MAYMSGNELCEAVQTQLGTLGYKIFGDPAEGWSWELGDYQPQGSACDSQGEAVATALHDLVQRTDELLNAAADVVARWESGDLAEAVRELDLCVKYLRRPVAESARGRQPGASATDLDTFSQVWLAHGDAPDGPWSRGAFLDFDHAIDASLARAHELIEAGHEIDLETLEDHLRSEQGCHASGLELTFLVEQIEVNQG